MALTWFVGWSIMCWLRRVVTQLTTLEKEPGCLANSSWLGLMSRTTTSSWCSASVFSALVLLGFIARVTLQLAEITIDCDCS